MTQFVSLRPIRQLLALTVLILSGFLLGGCNLPGQKDFSGLQVKTTDSTVAQVYLDGLHLGETPLEKRDIQPGTYSFRLEPNNDQKEPYQTQIHLYPGTLTSVLWNFDGAEPSGSGEILELEPLASQDRVEMSVITVPEGARVSLDETSYGLSPVIVESVTPGEYTLSIQAVGHVQKSLGVSLNTGYRLHVFSRLAKEAAALGNTQSSTGSKLDEKQPNLEEVVSDDEQSTNLLNTELVPTSTPSANPALQRTIPGSETSASTVQTPYVLIEETGTGWLRVRDNASSAGRELTTVDVGKKYGYLSTLNGWYEIEYEPGKTGWVSGQYATIFR